MSDEPAHKVIGADQVVLARVLHEDESLMTLEVIKNEQKKLQLLDGDRFLTLIFTAGKPWEPAA